jgi:hypothetical protein
LELLTEMEENEAFLTNGAALFNSVASIKVTHAQLIVGSEWSCVACATEPKLHGRCLEAIVDMLGAVQKSVRSLSKGVLIPVDALGAGRQQQRARASIFRSRTARSA